MWATLAIHINLEWRHARNIVYKSFRCLHYFILMKAHYWFFFCLNFKTFHISVLEKKEKKEDRPVAILSRIGPFVIFFWDALRYHDNWTYWNELNKRMHFILFAYDKNQQIFSDPNLFHLSSCLKNPGFVGIHIVFRSKLTINSNCS